MQMRPSQVFGQLCPWLKQITDGQPKLGGGQPVLRQRITVQTCVQAPGPQLTAAESAVTGFATSPASASTRPCTVPRPAGRFSSTWNDSTASCSRFSASFFMLGMVEDCFETRMPMPYN